MVALRHINRRLKAIGDPWGHVFEHSLWTILVVLVTAAMFSFLLLVRRNPWEWLEAPLGGLLVIGMGATLVLVPGFGNGTLGPVGDAISMVSVLVVGPWVWLSWPVLFAVGLTDLIRGCFPKGPQEGLTFPQALPAYLVATISEMGMFFAGASFGLGRTAFGREGGIEFATASLPVAVAPLALMTLRRAIVAARRRRRHRH